MTPSESALAFVTLPALPQRGQPRLRREHLSSMAGGSQPSSPKLTQRRSGRKLYFEFVQTSEYSGNEDWTV
jgi:hypothetical protein